MRILLVSSMYAGPAAPDFGAFGAQIELELVRLVLELCSEVVYPRDG